MQHAIGINAARLGAAALFACVTFTASADAITDWNLKAAGFITESKLGTPPAIRAMAIVQTAVHEAVNAATPRGSVDAAVAAANRATLSKLMPTQQAAIDAAYQAALSQVADGAAKTAGITIGEQAAAAVLATAQRRRCCNCGVTSSVHDRRRVRSDGHTRRHAVAAA